MSAPLNPVQIRRLLARTLTVALGGGPAPAQLLDRWAHADAREDAWVAALTWDGVGATLGWALDALELRTVAPPEVESLAAPAFEEACAQNVRFAADLARIGAEFSKADIPAVALKGSALACAEVAPALGARWMNELDVLVPESRVQDAAWALERLGYAGAVAERPEAAPLSRPYHESFGGPEGRPVTVHWRLGPARWGRAASAEAWFEHAQPSSVAGIAVPPAADLFWHLLLHDARNHAWSSGSLRAAFDLALAARAPGFGVPDVLARLDEDPRPEPLLDAIADAACLSPILAAEIEPSPFPRYLRLAQWRDTFGRRRWSAERVSEAIAWGATLDRARRFGGWRGVVERGVRAIPEAVPGTGPFAMARRGLATVRHALFVGVLAASHLLTVAEPPAQRRRALGPAAPDGAAGTRLSTP
jgi:Uncharacterised nucleotidyltransferase